MLRTTELDLARTGFAEGATITPEIAAAVRALLESRDTALHDASELYVTSVRFIQAVAEVVHGVAPGGDLPVDDSPDRLLTAIKDTFADDEAIKWMHQRRASHSRLPGPLWGPTPEQLRAIDRVSKERSFTHGVELAKRYIAENKKAQDEINARLLAATPVVNRSPGC